jgi:flagellar protein FlgJ
MSDLLATPASTESSLSRLHGRAEAALKQTRRLAENRNDPSGEARPDMEKSQIDETAKGFESIFLQMMFKEMRKTIEKSEFLEGNSSAMDMYEDMLDEQLVESLAAQEFLGIGKMVRDQIEDIQKTSHGAFSDVIRKRMVEQAAELNRPPNPSGAASKPLPKDL